MPNFTTTPYMGLTEPTVGLQPSPTWAQDLNANFTAIDSHDHTPGKGVPITTAGLNIDADLDFNSFNAIGLRSSRYTPISLGALTGDDVGCVIVSGVDLYYVDVNGVQIQITNNGAIVGTPGTIAGLVPPASATYTPSSSKFTWQSNTGVAADMDMGYAILREKLAGAHSITLQPPNSLAASYSLTFPAALPATTSVLTYTSAGVGVFTDSPTFLDLTVTDVGLFKASVATTAPLRVQALTPTGSVQALFRNSDVSKGFGLLSNFTSDTLSVTSDSATLFQFNRAGGASTTYPLDLNGSSLAGSGASSPLVLTNVSAGLAFQSASNAAIVPYGTRSVGIKTSGGTAYPAVVSSPGNTYGDTVVRGVLTLNFTTGVVTVVDGVGFTISSDPGSGAGVCNFKITYSYPFVDQPSVQFQAFAVSGSLGAYGVDPALGVDNTQMHFSCGGAGGLSNFHFTAIGQKGS